LSFSDDTGAFRSAVPIRGGRPSRLLPATPTFFADAFPANPAAALMPGADAMVVGTRFWASAEALTPKAYTDNAVGVTGDSTIRTKVLDALRGVPWPREYSFRFLKNKLTDEWADREAEAFRAFATLSAKYAEAREQNDLGTVAVTCGEVVGLLRERPSAESIVKSMAAHAADLLVSGSKLKFTSPS
jgi:nitronate monooxygenase